MLQSEVITMSSLSVNIQEKTIQNHELSNSNMWKKKYFQLQNNSSYLNQVEGGNSTLTTLLLSTDCSEYAQSWWLLLQIFLNLVLF